MDMDYLKTKEDLQLVRKALGTARALEEAEKKLEEMRPAFRKVSQAIIDATGMELWQTDADGGKFFWKFGKKESVYYADRVTALRALLDEEIEWS